MFSLPMIPIGKYEDRWNASLQISIGQSISIDVVIDSGVVTTPQSGIESLAG